MTTKNRRFVPFSEYGPALPTKGGIKARNQRGHFGETWWGQRWYQLLNEHTEQGRFSRAATYARKGQVTNINIKPGIITACVQGSSKTPYNVTIAVDQMDLNAWHRISREIAGDLRYAGPLLAGIMPRQLEDLFTKHKTELFPNPSTQLHPHCTCPDPYVPCKHITAACLLAVEEFDRDPFLILRTRASNEHNYSTSTQVSPKRRTTSPNSWRRYHRSSRLTATNSGALTTKTANLHNSNPPLHHNEMPRSSTGWATSRSGNTTNRLSQ